MKMKRRIRKAMRLARRGGDPRMMAYHDADWAGLSWSTILNKREAYRAAFAGFDPERVAVFDAFMRAVGLVNDHEVGCCRHAEVQAS
ncbi:MAG: DNA-3-methyladenine glycosylase I [Gemmatimonadota bacterium]